VTPIATFPADENWAAFWTAAAESPLFLVYKHSNRCIASANARRRIEQLASLRPELPILEVDVIAERPLSREISRRFGISHESPQAILVRGGHPVWHSSHSGVTVEAVTAQLDA